MIAAASSLRSMYAPPSTAPPGAPGSRWRVSDNLRDWMRGQGYVFHPVDGWGGPPVAAQRCDVEAEHAWAFMMLRAADLLDAEASRLERDMRADLAPLRKWSVVREGGGEEEARGGGGGEEGEEGEARGGGAPVDWNEDRVLFDIYAYTPMHAIYLFLLDFTQPLSDDICGTTNAFPADYAVPVAEVLQHLAYDKARQRWDLLGVTRRLADMDLGRYRLVPGNVLDLNREEYREARRAARRAERLR